jgi:hypothetical protein
MAVIACKGTVLKQTISAALVSVGQVISMSSSGAGSTSFKSQTLSSGVGIPYTLTGYAEGGTYNFECFHDPALAGHQAISALITTPAECVWQVVYSDDDGTIEQFTSVDVQRGVTVNMDDGLKASYTLKVTGLPNFDYSE